MSSWVEKANEATCDFSIRNLPYGVFRSSGGALHACVAIGDEVLDLAVLADAGLVDDDVDVFDQPSLNAFMARGPTAWKALRLRLVDLLATGGDPRLQDDAPLRERAFHPMARAEMVLPIAVSGYTDFYACRQHAENGSAILRGSPSLPPNWLSMPVGYNGRASTVVVSGTDVRRPYGQRVETSGQSPGFGPTRRLDFELEIGVVLGVPSEMGRPVTVAEADAMIFGYVLLNDWSARDIQAWESQPLGPFQSKAFATSVSPWVVSRDALEPFRVPTPPRERPLLPYLREPGPLLYDILLQVDIQPAGARHATTVCRTNYRESYYAPAQLVAHHAVSGCRMNVGDLLGSGTISGAEPGARGSLLELSWGGTRELALAEGARRTYLEDGDSVTLRGVAISGGHRIGFGACTGTILPALPPLDAWQDGPAVEALSGL